MGNSSLESLLKHDNAFAEPEETHASLPSNNQMRVLSLLPGFEGWTVEPHKLKQIIAVEFNHQAMSIIYKGRWSCIGQRSTSLPYRAKHRLRENWWRSSDGNLGVSADVVDKNNRHLYSIDGKSKQIHESNAQSNLTLTNESDVLRYLTFFCAAVHAEQGPFTILKEPSDIAVRESPSFHTTSSIAALEFNVEVIVDSDQESSWIATVSMQYSNAIFLAELKVDAKGNVDMRQDRIIAGDLDIGKFESTENIFYRLV